VSEYEKQDVDISLARASRVFDIAVAAIVAAAEDGEVTLKGDSISMAECEYWAERRGWPPVEHVRALSVLDRMRTVYTTGQVAKVLGVSPDLVIRLIDSGELEGYRLPQTAPAKHGGDRRVTKHALVEYLSKNPCQQAKEMGLKPAPTKRRLKA
jgi:excisionase family DNA binding protein